MKTTAEMLRALVDEAAKCDDDEEPRWAASMNDMWERYQSGRLRKFSPAQTSFIADTYDKVLDEPVYENLVSAGKVPIGEALRTPVPEVLMRPLPKKPPGRIK